MMNSLSETQLERLKTRGEASPVLSPMAGATSSDLYLLEYPDRREVLRVFRAERWEIPAGELSKREILILRALTGAKLPTPAPIDTFMDNGVLMSWLPGEVELAGQPDRQWLGKLARTLAVIHSSSITVPYAYESWNDTSANAPPTWWLDADLWKAAQHRARQKPAFAPLFIHRDYHPVNVLWQAGEISGVVDWINACMGPAGVDVAHCRLNLAIMYGLEAADVFLSEYAEVAPGYEHDSFWDLDDALGALPHVEPYAPWAEFGLTGLTTEGVRERLMAFVAAAIR